jgi:hypothetical protein
VKIVKAFTLIEMLLGITIGVILLLAMLKWHDLTFKWFMDYSNNQDRKAKGYYIKHLIEVDRKNSNSYKLCGYNDLSCISSLPDKIIAMSKQSAIKKGSDLICFFRAKKQMTQVHKWQKYWARYIVVTDSQGLQENDKIDINSINCSHSTIIDKIEHDKILLGLAPDCIFDLTATKLYKASNRCYLLTNENKLYIYEENRALLGILDNIKNLLINTKDLAVTLSFADREYTYINREK